MEYMYNRTYRQPEIARQPQWRRSSQARGAQGWKGDESSPDLGNTRGIACHERRCRAVRGRRRGGPCGLPVFNRRTGMAVRYCMRGGHKGLPYEGRGPERPVSGRNLGQICGRSRDKRLPSTRDRWTRWSPRPAKARIIENAHKSSLTTCEHFASWIVLSVANVFRCPRIRSARFLRRDQRERSPILSRTADPHARHHSSGATARTCKSNRTITYGILAGDSEQRGT